MGHESYIKSLIGAVIPRLLEVIHPMLVPKLALQNSMLTVAHVLFSVGCNNKGLGLPYEVG